MAPAFVSSRQMARAVEELTRQSLMTEEEEDIDYEGFMLVSNASRQKTLRFMEGEGKRPVRVRFVHGDLFAVEFPSKIHGQLTQKIGLCFWMDPEAVEQSSVPTTSILQDIWEPDLTIEPRHSLLLNSDPTVVVEVGVLENFKSLYRCATTYLEPSTTIQAVICVKIWARRTNGSRAMLFMLFERNNMVISQGFVLPTEVVSCGNAPLHPRVIDQFVAWGVAPASVCGFLEQGGDAPCTTANQQGYQVLLSAATVLHGSRVGIPPIVANGYNIDLFKLRALV